MNQQLIPQWVIPDFTVITPQWMKKQNLQGLVMDIDNTLAEYEEAEPSEGVRQWVKSLLDADIRLSAASNNNEERAGHFCRILRIPYVSKAKKPEPSGVFRAVEMLRLPPDKVGFLGDQIFTDIWAANRAGLTSILVEPISLKNPLYRVRRLFETRFIRRAKNVWEEPK